MTTPSSASGPAAVSGRILVVDDDTTVAEVIAQYLRGAGFSVGRSADGQEALAQVATMPPDLVILDLVWPGHNGLEVCRHIREQGSAPVVMLSALGGEDDRIRGLEAGADDYVVKPFSPRELILRVENVLRRTRWQAAASPWLRCGSLTLDPLGRRATRQGSELDLTAREFDLLAFFLRHPSRVWARSDLLRHVWDWEYGSLSTVTVHVRRLRAKIEDDPATPRLIATVWGNGYRFDPPNQPDRPNPPPLLSDAESTRSMA